MELIDHFLSVSGKADRTNAAADREALKGVVDNVGFVEVENGVEFVCLIAEGGAQSVMSADTAGHGHTECNGNMQETLDNNNGDRTGDSHAHCVV